MANEVTIRTHLTVTNAGSTASLKKDYKQDLTDKIVSSGVMSIESAPSATPVPTNGMTIGGWAIFKLLTPDSKIELGYDDSGTERRFASLSADDISLFRLAFAASGGPVVYLDTDAVLPVSVDYALIED